METTHTDVQARDAATSDHRYHHPAGTAIIAGSILGLALAWRLIGIQTTEAWRDEAVSLIHIHATWWDLSTRLPFVEDSPPLYFLLMKAWSLIFGSEWGMRLQAVLFGVAATAVLMKVAGMIHPRSWWVAGLLAAFSHVPVHLSQELRVYSLMTLLVVLGFWSAEHIVRDPKSRIWHFLMGLFGVLLAHCHAIGMFIYPMTWIYLLVRLPRPQYRALWSPWNVGTWLAGCIPMFCFNIHWALQHKTGGWWIDPLSSRTTYDLLHRFAGVEAVTLGLQEVLQPALAKPLIFLATMLIYGAYVLLAAIALFRRQTRRPATALLCSAAFFTLLMLATSLTGVPNMIERTLLPAWLPLLFLVAIGAVPEASGPRRALIGTVSALVIILSCAASWVWYAGFSEQERRPSFAESFRWMRDQIQPADMIVVTPSWAEDSTAYYLRDTIAGEQLFTTRAPAYAGCPPRHTLSSYRLTVTRERVKEGPWSERIRAAVKDRADQDYSVWIVCGYWQDLFRDPVLEQLESFFTQGFECRDTYTPSRLCGLMVRRFKKTGSRQVGSIPGPAGPACPHSKGRLDDRDSPHRHSDGGFIMHLLQAGLALLALSLLNSRGVLDPLA